MMIIIGGLLGILILGLIYWNYFANPESSQPPNHYFPSQKGFPEAKGEKEEAAEAASEKRE